MTRRIPLPREMAPPTLPLIVIANFTSSRFIVRRVPVIALNARTGRQS